MMSGEPLPTNILLRRKTMKTRKADALAMAGAPTQGAIESESPTMPRPARGLRILWVKIGGLWPLDTGGRLRSFHIVSELSRHHRVTVITTHAPGEDPDLLREHLPFCEVISIAHAPIKWRSAGFPLVLLRSWFSSLPVDLWKAVVPGLKRKVASLLENGSVDLCVADFMFAVHNVPRRRQVPVVFFPHNVEHIIWQRLSEVQPGWWRRALLALEWRKMRRCEARACDSAAMTIAVSTSDRNRLSAIAPGARVCAIPTGVDVDYFSPSPGPEQPWELVFTGSMDWHPNEDAILHFMDSILPAIRAEIPQVTVSVVGRNPSAGLKRAAERHNVGVAGTVPDVRPWIARAAVYIVPLRIGGGTRLKIFEALAMGKAVVSTTVGAEGLPVIDGKHIVRADESADFAARVVELLRNPARRRKLGAAGRKLVKERYGWPQVAAEFARRCQDVMRRD